jgi:hypothetical protein
MTWDGKDEFRVPASERAGEEVLRVALLHAADFNDAGALERDWVVEGSGRASIAEGRLFVEAFGSDRAATLWYRADFEADLLVEFAGVTVPPHGACNFNLFLHASELDGSDILSRQRSGAYSDYHEVNNYIFTLTEAWSRLRRDPGFQCLSEDLTLRAKPDVPYGAVILQQGGRLRAFVNDRLIHDVTDPQPHTRGRIALRTWNTALAYDRFRVWKLL